MSPFLVALTLLCLVSSGAAADETDPFVQCLLKQSVPSNIIFTPKMSSYPTFLASSVQNLRVVNPNTTAPLLVVTPMTESHAQATVFCSGANHLNLRVRSGGHDYEGLSYRSLGTPFVIVDMRNLNSITIDAQNAVASVQAGATIGELYYAIGQKSPTLAFPSGLCTTIGVGGIFSGGGLGTMMRNHGLSLDHIIDARVITADGKILDRSTMGEDLFWAIRGGGGGSFALILSFRITLVTVPSKVTVFNKRKTIKEGGAKLASLWNQVAHKLDNRLFIRTLMMVTNDGVDKTVSVTFQSLFLGGQDELLSLVGKSFPQLELNATDCSEMAWIETIIFFGNFDKGTPVTGMLNKTATNGYLKGKSDFITAPITEEGWEGIYNQMMVGGLDLRMMIIDPLGGKMDEISEAATPFPHRKGSLYNIQYLAKWQQNSSDEEEKNMDWMNDLYKYMTPYVAKNPRTSYLNYKDLQLGMNVPGASDYSKARAFGESYFKGNFKRLAQVKSAVDPKNFFWNEQSVPLYDGKYS